MCAKKKASMHCVQVKRPNNTSATMAEPKRQTWTCFFVMSKMSSEHTPEAASEIMLVQWFPSISDNRTKAITREVCGATSENFLKSHRNQLLCTLNSNLLMPRLMYIQCNLTQNGLHKSIRLSYPTLLLWVAVLNTNMVKIKYAWPKILAGHLVGSRGPKKARGPQFGNHCASGSPSVS